MQPISSKVHHLSSLSIPSRIQKEADESKPRVRKKLLDMMVEHRRTHQDPPTQDTPRSDSLVERLVSLS